ncbi:LOW QUALITY PROTEIN: paralemmin-3 [Brienomyrus brachyistius]|uniref:LOW QUALITY PROTEIN: paralemmin-3 n=1 Tax=Brienomyrus brachyistius TaxID=42636 RepID=UPI0020B1F288|nr:LOW QUALITY PROTEIN: paralemmin-3 [Brienomyrus brachyistius]
MDEAEKYQQRVQAIAEKRRLQEEQERKRREMEDEKLRLQQLKRKSLRDQWLMEGPSSPDGSGLRSPLWGSQAQEIEARIDQLQVDSQRLAEQERNLKDLHTNEENQTVGDVEHCSQAETAEGGVKDGASRQAPTPAPRLQRTAVQNGQEDRAVLGVVEVQVEKDLRTGATVIKSVAPVDPGEAVCSGEKVFDDGSKSVHTTVGAAGSQPSPEELGLILNALGGVGAPVEAKVIVNGRKEGGEEACSLPLEENGSDVAHGAASQLAPSEETARVKGTPKNELPGAEGEEGVITMTFLGYTETEPGQGLNGEDMGEIIRAERVIIMDDGEEQADVEKEPPPGKNAEPPGPPESSISTSQLEPADPELQPESETEPEITPEPGADVPSDSEKAPESRLDEASKSDSGAEGEQEAIPEVTENFIEPSQCTMNSTEPPSLRPTPDPKVDGAEPEDKAVEEPAALTAKPEQFQEIPLDGEAKPDMQPLLAVADSDAKKQVPRPTAEQQPLLSTSKAPPETEHAAPNRAEGADAPKHKSCQCCSIM